MSQQMHCPLCEVGQTSLFYTDPRRDYRRCDRCSLVFVPSGFYLDPTQEKAEYDLHRNEVSDPGYRRFLSRLADPLLERIPEGARGLDFGCGPGPALAAMLGEAGCQIQLFDVFYYPQPAALERSYQFITATEVVEHLHNPGQELAHLWRLVESGGYLGIMTKLVRDAAAFATWHYKNDPTHVCFFSEQTWRWWADINGARLERFGADVILLGKP